jgi:opacity protein-like surface antigen
MARGNKVMWALVLALVTAGTASAARRGSDSGDVKVFLKGGVGNYTGGLGDFVNAGPTWGVSLNLQPLSFLGFEVGYEGAYNGTDSGLLKISAMRHGGAALAKLSLPFIEVVTPFVGAGIGGSYIFVDSALGNAYNSDFVGEVPLVAGVEFNRDSFTAGVRANYRLLLDENLSSQLNHSQGGFFDVALTLGLRF